MESKSGKVPCKCRVTSPKRCHVGAVLMPCDAVLYSSEKKDNWNRQAKRIRPNEQYSMTRTNFHGVASLVCEETDMITIQLGWLLAIVLFGVIVGIFVGAALVGGGSHDRVRYR